MDEDSVWMKFPVRERGIYREFHESMVTHYQTLDKDPFVAYFSYPDQLEGGYEPKAVRAVLYGFIQRRATAKQCLDLSLRTRVVAVKKTADTVTGVTVEFADAADATAQRHRLQGAGRRDRIRRCDSADGRTLPRWQRDERPARPGRAGARPHVDGRRSRVSGRSSGASPDQAAAARL